MKSFNWMQNFDPEVGLWWAVNSPAHTSTLAHLGMKVHPGPDAATRLLWAAELNGLSFIPVEQVLTVLAGMRSKRDHRLLCWYWEEHGQAHDANANFFTGLGLIGLWLGHRDKLSPTSRNLLQELFHDLQEYFMQSVEDPRFYYLNAWMGEAVCAWLLMEITGANKGQERLEHQMRRAARSWRNEGYGYGEHLSDIYATVALQQVSLLVLFGRSLPEDLKRQYAEVLGDLLAIDDFFAGGPRVPAIRNYVLVSDSSGCARNALVPAGYRKKIQPLLMPVGNEFSNNPRLDGLLYTAGWHTKVPAAKKPAESISISCHGGVEAKAYLQEDIRLGTLSRFPLLAGAENTRSGMAWQSFPVAFWRPMGDWGFLQWQHDYAEGVKCYPSKEKDPRARSVPLAGTVPPVVGHTFCLQEGGNILALRIIPAFDLKWTAVSERLHVKDCSARVEETDANEQWHQLLLHYPERLVAVQHLRLVADSVHKGMTVCPEQGSLEWDFGLGENALKNLSNGEWRTYVSLWGISKDGRVLEAPEIVPLEDAPSVPRLPEESAFLLTWRWPGMEWKVRIDVFSDNPLQFHE